MSQGETAATTTGLGQPRSRGVAGVVAAAALVAAAVAVGLYVFGTQHTPDYTTSLFGKTGADTFQLKSWLATGVLAFAAVQLALALWMYGRLPGLRIAPPAIGPVHRALGSLALLLTIPIAYHCAFAYGVQTGGVAARVAVHSIAGCFLYGAFAAKLLFRHSPGERLPRWALPVAGGALVVAVVALWYTSSLWYFNDYSLPVL